jgi:hypothetical protein
MLYQQLILPYAVSLCMSWLRNSEPGKAEGPEPVVSIVKVSIFSLGTSGKVKQRGHWDSFHGLGAEE